MPINITKQALLKLPRPIKRGIVIFCDLFLCGFSLWLAYGLRLDQWDRFHDQYWITYLIAVGFSLPLFVKFGLYKTIFRYVGSAAFTALAQVFIVYAGLFFSMVTLFGLSGVPRSIGIIHPTLFFIGLGLSRFFARHWLGGIDDIHRSHLYKPVALIYGAGEAGRQLSAALSSNKQMVIKGFIDDDHSLQRSTINGIFVYPNFELQKLVHRLGITDVLLAIPSAAQNRRREIISSLNGCGVRVRTLPGLFDLASGRVKVSDLHDLDMNDLLGRSVVPPDMELLKKNISNHVVLVTGAGGSIGSELCRQIIKLSPKSLILIDSSEHSLYLIYEELKTILSDLNVNHLLNIEEQATSAVKFKTMSIKLVPCLASVRDKNHLLKIFKTYDPYIVFHAAAYKHVPLVEQNHLEGIRNNVFGTDICTEVSLESGVSHFVLVSTDKAVRPTNVMGVTKRIAEMILQAKAELVTKSHHSTNFSMVRFGNVLGSSGSVAPLFNAQISIGGPITLTHPEVTRYFMTIPEAAQLVIQASSMSAGGDVFVLDMGEPVRIYDLAVKMIYLSGLLVKDDTNPYGDIEIKITGLRPGEKLFEELLIGNNPLQTIHPKIMKANEDYWQWDFLQQELKKLHSYLNSGDDSSVKTMLKKLVPEYQPSESIEDAESNEIFSN